MMNEQLRRLRRLCEAIDLDKYGLTEDEMLAIIDDVAQRTSFDVFYKANNGGTGKLAYIRVNCVPRSITTSKGANLRYEPSFWGKKEIPRYDLRDTTIENMADYAGYGISIKKDGKYIDEWPEINLTDNNLTPRIKERMGKFVFDSVKKLRRELHRVVPEERDRYLFLHR